MSDQKPVEPKTSPDDLTKTKKPSDIRLTEEQLTEEQLKEVAGGFAYSKIKVSYNPD